MKYIGNLPEMNVVHTHADRYDYVYSSNPTIDVNPSVPYATWLNSATGELFVCTTITEGDNLWVGQCGTIITASPPVYFPVAEVLASTASGISDCEAMTTDGTNLIVFDDTADVIKVMDGVSNTVLDTITPFNPSCWGLAFDGTNLISGGPANKVYVHVGVSGTLLTQFEVPTTNNVLLAYDGTNLLVSGYGDSSLWVMDGVSSNVLDTKTISTGTDELDCFDGNLVRSASGFLTIYDGLDVDTVLRTLDIGGSNARAFTFLAGELVKYNTDTDCFDTHKHEGDL